MWIKFDAGDVDADLSCDHELCENQCSKSYSFLECVNESTSIFSSMYDREKYGIGVPNMMQLSVCWFHENGHSESPSSLMGIISIKFMCVLVSSSASLSHPVHHFHLTWTMHWDRLEAPLWP